MAGGVGGAGGASGGLGSSGGFSSGLGSIGGDAGAASMSISAATPTDFSAQSESSASAASSSSANAQVSTGFDASASMSDFGSNMAMLGASGADQPYGGADATLWKPQQDETPPVASQPSDDVLAQVCAAYSANQM